MIPVAYPEPHFKIKTEAGKQSIFCLIRKRWMVLTPEEWVRQNFLAYLISVLKYPATLIAVEKEISLGELNKRFDILVYNGLHQPWMMIECKEPEVGLNETVLQQALRYHISIPVEIIIITNGGSTIGWKKEGGELMMIKDFPAWIDS